MTIEKITKFIGGLFTIIGLIVFIWSFLNKEVTINVAIVGILLMILGELVDLPYRIKDKFQ